MKLRLAIVCMACLVCTPVIAGNYILNLDGHRYDLDLGKPATIRLPDGHRAHVRLVKKAILPYKWKDFSFEYPGKLSPISKDLGDGTYQTNIITPSGSVILIQEYTRTSPCFLVDRMLTELTKDEVKAGYKITRGLATQKLASGTLLKGRMAVSRSGDSEYTRHVLCYAGHGSGMLIVTQYEKSRPQEDRNMIDTFWRSLRIALK